MQDHVADKVNREVALQVDSSAAYDYLRTMFEFDWAFQARAYLPLVMANYVAPPNHLLISKVFYLGSVSPITGSEWVQLYNPTAITVSLNGFKIDVGFLGGAQIDRFGNINATVIGPYAKPKVRLPGSGGSAEIAAWANRVYCLTPHQARRFPERCDFVTSAGFLSGRKEREAKGLRGSGPQAVVTDLGILTPDQETGDQEHRLEIESS